MSKKLLKNNEDKISTSPDKFSFLELNEYLAKGKIDLESVKKLSKPKNTNDKKETEKKHQLKIKPNENIAREQTSEDMMYIEKADEFEKEELEKEKQKEKEKESKKESFAEKPIPKKNIEKKKFDKRIVTINLDKQKNEEKSKNKDKKDFENKIKDKDKSKDSYNVELLINNIKAKDPKAYTPIMLPFEEEKIEKKSLKEELMEDNEENQNKLFVFQFPRQIPIKDLEIQTNLKEEENVNEEPKYDENGFLQTPEFNNSFNEIKDNTLIGKLIIMKSGKIKIKMGDIYFDINEGALTKFAQYSTVINGDKENQAYILGQPYNRKLIVTPEFD